MGKNEGEELKNIMKGKGLQMGTTAVLLGMTRQNFSHHLRKPKLDEDFKRLVKEKLPDVLQMENKMALRKVTVGEVGELNTIHTLAESNKVLADNNKIAAEAQIKLVDAHAEIVRTNSQLANMLQDLIAGDHSKNPVADPAILVGFLEVVADLGVPKLWRTRKEGIHELGIRLGLEKLKNKKGGNVAGVHS